MVDLRGHWLGMLWVKRCVAILFMGVSGFCGMSCSDGETSTGCYDSIVFSKAKRRLGGRVHTMISGGGPLRPQVQEFLRL